MKRALAAAAAVALASPVAAAAALRVRSFDTSGYPTLRITAVTPTVSRTPPTLLENGVPVTGLRAENLGRKKSIVLAIDRSQSMKGKPLERAVAAARAFVRAKPLADRVAVTTFATKAVMLTGFSSSTIDADSALSSISVDPVQGTRLYDDLLLSTRRLAREPFAGRVIVVVTDGNETRSKASLETVVAAARKARVSIYVVAIESSRFTPEPLKRLAAGTAGAYHGTTSTKALTAVYSAIAKELKRTWRLEYLTAGRPGENLKLQLSLKGSGSVLKVYTLPGSDGGPPGPSKLIPKSAYAGWGTAVLALFVALLVLLAFGLAVGLRGRSKLQGRLASHIAPVRARIKPKRGRERLEALNGLFRATEGAFQHTKHWHALGRLIERADLPLRTVEFVYLMAGCALFLGILTAVAAAATIVILVAFVIGAALPFGFLSMKARRRQAAFENQLPDLLISMAASLKAGHSFRQGLQSVVDEGIEPASKELKRVLTETRLGRPMEDALAEMAERVASKNFSFIITAVNIQSQVGGSLAGLFDMVADTVRQRQQFARKIKSLTAMGRMSAYVLIGLPFLVALGITALNASYMEPLYHSSAGHKLIMIGLVMILFGSAILKKIVSFKG